MGLSVLDLTDRPDAPPLPALSSTSAVTVGFPTTPRSTAPVVTRETVHSAKVPATPPTEARD